MTRLVLQGGTVLTPQGARDADVLVEEGRIVEIKCSTEHPEAAIQLLGRACGDAIEKDFLRVSNAADKICWPVCCCIFL